MLEVSWNEKINGEACINVRNLDKYPLAMLTDQRPQSSACKRESPINLA